MNTRTVRFLLLIFIASMIGYYVGVTKVNFAWDNHKPNITVEGKEPPSGTQNIDMTMFWQVLDKIETGYYDKSAINPQKLVNGAISGMVESLDDPYTVFLPPQQNDDFKQGLAGEFQGIGAELGMRGKEIIVVSPLDGSPAKKAGVVAGDTIYKVDGQTTLGWTIGQAVEKIRGKKGTIVTLSLITKQDADGEGPVTPKEVKITRDTITVKSVTSWVKSVKDADGIKVTDALAANKDKKIAYIRLSQFGDKTNQEWVNVTNDINTKMQNDPSIAGIVLDLRNNPGGYLTDAVFISSEFIKSGTVVMQENGRKERNILSVSRKGLLTDVPVVVLINKGSASAAEIVSGALSDHKRAKLVGETSFGKGTIQQAEDLGAGAGVHITIAKWLTPNGTWVHTKGLTPDIPVAQDSKDPAHDVQLEKAIESLLE